MKAIYPALQRFCSILLLLSVSTTAWSQTTTDYGDSSHWLNVPTSNANPVDVFYLYPTSWTPSSPDQIYSTIDDPTLIAGATDVYQRQGTIFEPLTNVYAPFYRQANGALTLSLPLDQQLELLNGIPKEDAYAALDYYFENYNDGRPFILAGHSQGADILTLVLAEYMKERPEIYDRMIAAYVIGYSVTDDYLAANPHLQFAEGSDDVRKIISWNTESPGATDSNPVLLPGAIVINPLNWRRDGTYAGLEWNLGSLVKNDDGVWELTDGVADAQVDAERGVIATHADQAKYGMPPVFGFANTSFHGYDMPFYYMNIRENVLRRSAVALSMYQSEIYADAAYTTTRPVRAFADQLPGMGDFVTTKPDCSPCSPCGSKANSWDWFATPFGLWTRQDSHGSFSGYDFNAYGIALGGVKTAGKYRYGFALGYNDQTQKMKDYHGRVEADLFHAAVFAGRKVGNLSLEASAGYAHGWNDADRSVVFSDYARFDNKASFDQDAWAIRLKANKERKLRRGFRAVFGIGLDYVGVRTGSLTESCIGQSEFQGIVGFSTNTAMRLKSSTYHSLELPVSLTIDKTWNCNGTKVTPYLTAAWIPELLDDRSETTASFVDGNVTGVFAAESISPWDSHGRLATGLKVERNRSSFGIDYVFDFASRYTEHRLAANFSRRF